MLKAFPLALALALGSPLPVRAADVMKAFPPAGEGMDRYVLHLPEQQDEAALQVELLVGRTVRVDKANRYFLGGSIESQSIPGWGYTRYTVDKLGPMAGTRMAVDPKAPKVDRFITLGGPPYLVRYNSRLPLVVYVPEDAEVRYRIWRAEPQVRRMNRG